MDAHITSNFSGTAHQCGPDTLTHTVPASPFPSTSPVATPAVAWLGLYPTLVAILLGYMALCKALRFRAIRSLQKTMGFADRPSLARMTSDEAQLILKFIIEREFPTMYELSLQFAIFKTYGFESMSRLIVATKNLADPQKSFKRYEDTTVIFGEFSLFPPSSDRALNAIARMNYLHAPYRSADQITNADLLYTLSVCVTEPTRFMALYEWRSLTDMERAAIGTFWKGIGEAMGIRYDGVLCRAGRWRDGLDFADDLAAWAKEYEIQDMKPSKMNLPPSRELVRLMTWHVPRWAKPLAEEVLVVLMGDRVREAFLFPEPGIAAALVAYSALFLRRFCLRHLALPRLLPKRYFSDPDPLTGRINHYAYLVRPYYNPSTFWARYGPESWLRRLLGGYPPGTLDGVSPQGYLFSDIGPSDKVGLGKDEMEKDVQRMRRMRRGGCPFSDLAGQ